MSPFAAAPSLTTRLLSPSDDEAVTRARRHARIRRRHRRSQRVLTRY
jgi:hypothetical protein